MGRCLFKYTKAEYIDSILKDGGRIKLSNPNEFGDLFDCRFLFSDENKEKSYQLIQNVALFCEFRNEPVFKNNKMLQDAYRYTKERIKKTRVYNENNPLNIAVYKFLSSRDDVKKVVKENKQKFDNDFSELIDKLSQKTLIASLTCDNADDTMWDYFGDKNTGICVEYEFSDEKALLDVVYTDERNEFDLYTVLKYIIPAKYFGVGVESNYNDPVCFRACYLPYITKPRSREKEKETRLVLSEGEVGKVIYDNGIPFYPLVKIKSVTLGCKTKEADAEKIRRLCDERSIDLYASQVNLSTKRIEVRKLK